MSKYEQWRPVVGHEDSYEVSSHGRMRSLDRVYADSRGWMYHRRGKLLNPGLSGTKGKQYRHVSLTMGARQKVHAIVAAAFIGPRPPGMQVCHIDGDRFNNQADNLRYGTPSENNLDIGCHGRNHHANKTHCPQNHRLVAPNLVLSGKYGRQCRTCAAARAYVQRWPESVFEDECLRYYLKYAPRTLKKTG